MTSLHDPQLNPLPIFSRAEDGTVTVDGFTDRLTIAPELLFSQAHALRGETSHLLLEGDWIFRIRVANGEAVYRVTGWEGHAFTAELVETTGPRKEVAP